MEEWAIEQRAKWDASEHQIHKRPPFRAHSFDTDDRFWVVGSSGVSVLQAWSGPEALASRLAEALNQAGRG